MEPFKAKSLPIDYNIDKELLRLISEANEKYSEYKTLLGSLEFDFKFFLQCIIEYRKYYILKLKRIKTM